MIQSDSKVIQRDSYVIQKWFKEILMWFKIKLDYSNLIQLRFRHIMHGILFLPRDDISLKNCASVDSMRNELVPVGTRQTKVLHSYTLKSWSDLSLQTLYKYQGPKGRLLQSAAQRALRSERRSQKWERERERRSEKRLSAESAAHFPCLRSSTVWPAPEPIKNCPSSNQMSYFLMFLT